MSVVSLARMAGVTGLAVEESLPNREQVARADAHQHDVDQLLADDFSNVVAEFGQAAIRSGAGGRFHAVGPGAETPKAMSASLASARMKSRQVESAASRASFASSDLFLAFVME